MGPVDRLQEVEHALSAHLLRVPLLGAEPPRVADRYVVKRLLGRGASGVVVAAEDVRLRRTVALKLGLAGADTSNLAEARALAALDHPNVVRVHDVAEVSATFDGQPFHLSLVCMQYVDGFTLRDWLQQEPRSWREILAVFVAAGRGLAAAHACKLVHRDFKLDNVLIRSDGVAQVIDFGFALAARSTAWTSDLQRQIAGTYPYMAPEARLGQVTRRSDQYSFGVSLVEALVGEPRPATGARPAQVPNAVWAALGRATAAEAGDRFPDMDALLTILEAGLRSKDTRPRAVWVLSGVAVVGLLLGLAGIAAGPRLESLLSASWSDLWQGTEGTQPGAVPTAEEDQGTPEPSDASASDASVEAVTPLSGPTPLGGLDGGVPVVTATLPDAAVASGGAPLERVCPDRTGTYDLTTQRTLGGRPADATFGSYQLRLMGRGEALRARLTKTGYATPKRPTALRDELENEEVTLQPDCTLEVSARHGDRTYRFSLSFRGTGGTGTFTAEGDPLRGTYSGSVRIQKVTGP